MSATLKKTIDNERFIKVLMDYAAFIFTEASSLSSSMIHVGELLSVLRDLRQPLKYAHKYVKSRASGDIELHDMFQRLLSALQGVDDNLLQKVKWKNSLDLLALDSCLRPHIKTLEHEVSSLLLFLKRIGLYGPSKQGTGSETTDTPGNYSIIPHSDWALNRPVSEHPSSGTLWPLLFLPERNFFHLPRQDLMCKTLAMMQPDSKKPTHLCVVNKGGYGGLGRTQLILESAYKSIERGLFGVVFWLSCSNESSLMSSYRQIARKISKIDPSFSDSLLSVEGEMNFHECTRDLLAPDLSFPLTENEYNRHNFTISLVVTWLSKLPMPYLLIFDSADDSSNFSPEMFPQIGQGSIVIVTGFSQLSRWTALLQTRPKAIELTTLSYEEGLAMGVAGLDASVCDQADKEAVVELLTYLHNSPSDFCNAILTINCMRNTSFVDIGESLVRYT
jgi:hypothetical protein